MQYTPAERRYDNPEWFRRCGHSGLKLPRLSLGLWHNFGDNACQDTAKSLIFSAFDHGITHFDIANNYGPPPGSAERRFGRILKEDLTGYRDELVISTKAGFLMWPGPYGDWGSRKYLISSLDRSLQRIGVDYVDIFYHHRPDPDTPLEETMGALSSIVRSGKALYVGISNYNAEQTARAADLLKKMGTPCLIHQPKYNLFHRTIEKGLIDRLEEKGIGCIPFCPLAQGVLTDRYIDGIPEDSRAAGESVFLSGDDITAAKLKKLRKLQAIALRRGQTLAQLALAWVLRLPVITTALIGASKVSQIEDNVKALDNSDFSDEELREIDTILAE